MSIVLIGKNNVCFKTLKSDADKTGLLSVAFNSSTQYETVQNTSEELLLKQKEKGEKEWTRVDGVQAGSMGLQTNSLQRCR